MSLWNRVAEVARTGGQRPPESFVYIFLFGRLRVPSSRLMYMLWQGDFSILLGIEFRSLLLSYMLHIILSSLLFIFGTCASFRVQEPRPSLESSNHSRSLVLSKGPWQENFVAIFASAESLPTFATLFWNLLLPKSFQISLKIFLDTAWLRLFCRFFYQVFDSSPQ